MMKKTIKKATTWLVFFCMIVGFVPAFGSVAAAAEKPVRALECTGNKTDWFADKTDPAATAVLTVRQPEEDLENMDTGSLSGSLWAFLQAIGTNLRSLPVDDILKLPANAMDDVVTYIFAVLRWIGINLDTLYEKLTSIFSVQ